MSKEALVDVAMAVAENIDRDFARSLLKNTLIAMLQQKRSERQDEEKKAEIEEAQLDIKGLFDYY